MYQKSQVANPALGYCSLSPIQLKGTTMNASCNPVPVTTGPCEVCYACLRDFHRDELGGCMGCGESLCMDHPACSGKCRCDEEAERICDAHPQAQGIHPVPVTV